MRTPRIVQTTGLQWGHELGIKICKVRPVLRYLLFGGDFDRRMVFNPLDTVVGVQIFMQGDLESGRTALAG